MKKFAGFILGVCTWAFGYFVVSPKSEVYGYMFIFIGCFMIGYFLTEILRKEQ